MDEGQRPNTCCLPSPEFLSYHRMPPPQYVMVMTTNWSVWESAIQIGKKKSLTVSLPCSPYVGDVKGRSDTVVEWPAIPGHSNQSVQTRSTWQWCTATKVTSSVSFLEVREWRVLIESKNHRTRYTESCRKLLMCIPYAGTSYCTPAVLVAFVRNWLGFGNHYCRVAG